MNVFKTITLVLFGIACALVAFTILAAVYSTFHVLIDLLVLCALVYLGWRVVFHRPSRRTERRP
ncbi:MAG TPA: hypothetical protein VGS61_03485 [Acidimicrobiales bacterium]|nr:hypothetical protein [Acidimicrobiales bacterium]